jgi:hypothetical protein
MLVVAIAFRELRKAAQSGLVFLPSVLLLCRLLNFLLCFFAGFGEPPCTDFAYVPEGAHVVLRFPLPCCVVWIWHLQPRGVRVSTSSTSTTSTTSSSSTTSTTMVTCSYYLP